MSLNQKIGFCIVFSVIILITCAAGAGSGKSTRIGYFKGPYTGAVTDGWIEIKIYRNADDAQTFEGSLVNPTSKAFRTFEGTLTGNQLKGSFHTMSGTVTGTLSADGQQMSGEYYISNTRRGGTWEATRKK